MIVWTLFKSLSVHDFLVLLKEQLDLEDDSWREVLHIANLLNNLENSTDLILKIKKLYE